MFDSIGVALDTVDKLQILADAAKYDVACTSSGIDRNAVKGQLGNTSSAGICHAFSADGRCISLLKVLFTNACVYDCAYCVNRCSNDIPRAMFKPRELAELTIGFYRRNYIEGLFLSSGVVGSPDYTTELIIESLRILREEFQFRGYIHAKAIPGTSSALIEQLGKFLSGDGPVGKKLDFLIQEMNREANTIGSKSNDLEITSHMLDAKAEIEKIREQVQNIE